MDGLIGVSYLLDRRGSVYFSVPTICPDQIPSCLRCLLVLHLLVVPVLVVLLLLVTQVLVVPLLVLLALLSLGAVSMPLVRR